MKFVKEHLIGIIVGVVAYELYTRTQASNKGGGQ